MLRFKYQAFDDTTSENVFKAKKQANPITLVVLGYMLIITVGAVLLRLPVSTREPIDFLQALFTATSAVCVTGLSVIDISTTFTGFGYWVLVALMQLGGLGIMKSLMSKVHKFRMQKKKNSTILQQKKVQSFRRYFS